MSRQPPNSKRFSTQAYLSALIEMQKINPPGAIRNVETEIHTTTINAQMVPLTVNRTEYTNSYVCSPYTAYIHYARDELGLVSDRMLQWALKQSISLVSGLFRLGRINQTVSINNWLFSTNPLPDWNRNQVEHLTRKLSRDYPQHSLSIRSLNPKSDHKLMNDLTDNGWTLMPARQVYLFAEDDPSWWKRNNIKNDQRLLNKTLREDELKLVKPHQHKSEDFTEIETCFNQLFIEKHSVYNPQFTRDFFELLHRQKQVEFFSFRDPAGRIVASIGLWTHNDILTAPIVGYDTRLPKSTGLYRLLIALLLKETRSRGKTLNLSSGAGHFKRQRGGQPVVEYTAYYVNHLSCSRRWFHKSLSGLLNRYAPPLFERFKI